MLAEAAVALHADAAIRALVAHRHRAPRQHRQLLGAEVLAAVADPAFGIAVRLGRVGVAGRTWLGKVRLFEIRVEIAFPVEHRDQIVEVVVVLRRHVLHHLRPVDHQIVGDQRLPHRGGVAGPLRLVGTQRTRRVQNARRHVPAGAKRQPVGLRQLQNVVIAFVPAGHAGLHLFRRRARLQPEEGVRERPQAGVVLRRVKIGLRLAQPPHSRRHFVAGVHVVRQRIHVVEELGVHHQAAVLAHRFAAQEVVA